MNELTDKVINKNYICVDGSNLDRVKAEFLMGKKILLRSKSIQGVNYIFSELGVNDNIFFISFNFLEIVNAIPDKFNINKTDNEYILNYNNKPVYVGLTWDMSIQSFENLININKKYRENKYLFEIKRQLKTMFWDFDFGIIRSLTCTPLKKKK